MATIILSYKGSATSGNRMHAGRPGKVGGSMPRNYQAALAAYNNMSANERATMAANYLGSLTDLNRVGLQAIIDYDAMKISQQAMFNIINSPASARASGTYTSAAATAARAAQQQPQQPTSDLTEDVDWTDAGLAVANRNDPTKIWVSNAEDAWILGIDKTNAAGKQAIADYKAGNITKEDLHETLSPAYKDLKAGAAMPDWSTQSIMSATGRQDFLDLFQTKIEGTSQRRSYIPEEAWVSQIKLSSLNDNQWGKFSEYKQGLLTLDELRRHVAPHTLLPTVAPKAAPKAAVQPVDMYTKAKYVDDPRKLPSYNKAANMDNYDRATNGGDGILDILAKDQGFNGKPQLISRTEFSQYIKAGEPAIFRGTSSTASSRTKRYKEFRTGEYYAGFGIHGQGTYASTVQSTARSYDGGDSHSRILAMTIRKDARVIDETALENIQSTDRTTASVIRNDLGRYAASLGFDAIKIPNEDYNGGDFWVILNRTCLRVVTDDFTAKDDHAW